MAADAPPTDQADVTVVVTAERTLQPASESIASVTVITAKQIRDQGAQSVADVVRLAPGVSVVQNGQTGANANAHIRGTSASQVLVLVDGQRLSSSAFDSTADLSKIPVTDIARVEVIRGPVSSLYGSDAIGGVINIITKETLGSKGEAKLGFGSSARQTKYMMLGGGNERSTWQLTSDFPAYSGARTNSDYTATDLSGRLSFTNLRGWNVSLHGNSYTDSLGLPGMVSMPSVNDHQNWDRNGFDISAGRAIGGGDLELHAYSIDQRLRETNPDWFYDSDISGKTQSMDAVYRFARGIHNWTLGGEYRTEDYRDVENASVAADTSISNTGVFLQDRMVVDKATSLLAGARVDNHSTAGSKFTPRVGLNYAMSGSTHMRLSYAGGFRAPSLVDLYYNNPGFSTHGNPDLKPEKSRQYELGFNTQSGKDTLDVALFVNEVTDQIIFAMDPKDPSQFTFLNVTRARQQGLEVSWDHPITDATHLSLFYTCLNAQNLTTHSRLPGIPYNQAGLTLSSRLKSWNAALTGRWASERPFGTLTAGSAAIFDLTLVRQMDKPLNPYLTIRNLMDTEYEEVAGYPAEGRSFELGMRSTW
jgi:outer membrane cobalamin receptor